jgi:hypothetical protein
MPAFVTREICLGVVRVPVSPLRPITGGNRIAACPGRQVGIWVLGNRKGDAP